MKTIDKVRSILSEYPETRNSDPLLISMVWWKYNQQKLLVNEGESYIRLRDVQQLEKPASIIRCRQKFQEEGEYPAEITVQMQRSAYESDMQNSMNKSYWETSPFLQ